MSLSNSGPGFITCSYQMQGRYDAFENKVLKSLNDFKSEKEYISYYKGVASYRSFMDVKEDMLSDISTWPQDAIDEYNFFYQDYKGSLKD